MASEQPPQPSLTAEERVLATAFGDRFQQNPEVALQKRDPISILEERVSYAQARLELAQRMYYGMTLAERIAFNEDMGIVGETRTNQQISQDLGVPAEEIAGLVARAAQKVRDNYKNIKRPSRENKSQE